MGIGYYSSRQGAGGRSSVCVTPAVLTAGPSLERAHPGRSRTAGGVSTRWENATPAWLQASEACARPWHTHSLASLCSLPLPWAQAEEHPGLHLGLACRDARSAPLPSDSPTSQSHPYRGQANPGILCPSSLCPSATLGGGRHGFPHLTD